MKKAWILEKFNSVEDLKKEIEFAEEMFDHFKSTEKESVARESLDHWNKILEKNPEGMWLGCQGSNNYYTFCGRVRDYLKTKDEAAVNELKASLGEVSYSDDVKTKFKEAHRAVKALYRVVEAEIEDDAKTWVNYKTVKENSGVYNFLWIKATRG